MNTILEMKAIEKSFPGVKALVNAQISIEKGEVHAFLGENGAGKSTLMKILVGIHQRDAGTIVYKGSPVNFRTARESSDAGISIIYQEFNLIPKLTVAENIFLGRQPTNGVAVSWAAMYKKAKEILDDLGVNIDPHSPIEKLGIAQQQMVEIAKALSIKSDIIIMDEPTAALTDSEIEQLFRIIRQLRENNVAVIYISHRMEEIYQICDRATILRDGTYIDTVNVEDTTIDDIIRMMVGREMKDIYPKVQRELGEEILRAENIHSGSMVKGVNFTIRKGEIVGFAGLMGAGRTETMRAIFGADKKTDGSVYLFGEKVNINNPKDAIEKGIGLLTEDRKGQGLVLGMSVKHNISLTSLKDFTNKFGLLDLKLETKRAEELSKQLSVRTPSVEQIVKYLSGGNQQKVVLAKWINRDSSILIFDEPTRGIDVGAKAEIYELLHKLVDQGIGIIMISSDMHEVIGISDRIYVMHEGKITGEVDADSTTQDEILEYATGVRNMMEGS